MDALRKAEEEKKKAEQETEQDAASSAADAPAEETPPPIDEPVVAGDIVDAESTDSNDIEPEVSVDDAAVSESPIPDVTLEFEEESIQQTSSIEETEVESPADSVAEDHAAVAEESVDEPTDDSTQEFPDDGLPDVEVSDAIANFEEQPKPEPEVNSLSLEPIHETGERKPLANEVVPDYSAETPLSTLTKQAAASEPVLPRDNVAATSVDGSTVEAEKAAEEAERTGAVKESADSSEPSRRQEEIVDREARREQSDPKPIQELKLTPKRQSLSERSEPDRQAARSVFAAKRKNKRPFRMRRSQRIWLLQIVVGLIVCVGAYYYFFVVNSGGNEFAIPEEFLANQGTYSEQFNNSIEESNDFTDETAAVIEETPDLSQPAIVDIGTPSLVDNVPIVTDPVDIAVDPGVPDAAVDETNLADTDAASDVETDEPTTDSIASTEGVIEEVDSLASDQVQQPVVSSISFTRTESAAGIDPALQQAYSAFQREDLATAQDLYQQVLQESPRQRDALLGLASIAVRNNETAVAMELYSRLLARDPSDTVARAGLLGVRPAGGSEQQERELRRLVEQRPEVAPVLYTLGNFYASEGRWNEAQRHYFNALQQAKTDALQGVPVHPDYAFNLAVSLERINQARSARTYYAEAITFAESVQASFDVNIARNRMASLAEVTTE